MICYWSRCISSRGATQWQQKQSVCGKERLSSWPGPSYPPFKGRSSWKFSVRCDYHISWRLRLQSPLTHWIWPILIVFGKQGWGEIEDKALRKIRCKWCDHWSLNGTVLQLNSSVSCVATGISQHHLLPWTRAGPKACPRGTWQSWFTWALRLLHSCIGKQYQTLGKHTCDKKSTLSIAHLCPDNQGSETASIT